MIYALDTNILLDFIWKKMPVVKEFDKLAIAGIRMVIPSVVDYEVLRGFCHTPSLRKEAVYNSMRVNCPIVEVNADIWKRAAYTTQSRTYS